MERKGLYSVQMFVLAGIVIIIAIIMLQIMYGGG